MSSVRTFDLSISDLRRQLRSELQIRNPRVNPTITLSAPGAASRLNNGYTLSNGNATGGTFTLTFDGQTTGAINHNASAATIQTAITGLSSVGVNNAVVAGAAPTWTITLSDSIARSTKPLTITSSTTGGTSTLSPLTVYYATWVNTAGVTSLPFSTVNPSVVGLSPFIRLSNCVPRRAGTVFPNNDFVRGDAQVSTVNANGDCVEEYYVDATMFEIRLLGQGGNIRVFVDDDEILRGNVGASADHPMPSTSSWVQLPNDGQLYNLMIDFGGVRAYRKVRVERGQQFGCGVRVGRLDEVTRARPNKRLRAIVVGDSFIESTGGQITGLSVGASLCDDIGYEWLLSGVGGTGYVNTGNNLLSIGERLVPPTNSYRLSLGGATGGTFTLSFGGQTTAPLAWNASFTTIRTAVQGLSTVGAGNFQIVTRALVFRGPVANSGGPLDADFSSLTGTIETPTLTTYNGDIGASLVTGPNGQQEKLTVIICAGYNDTMDNGISVASLDAECRRVWAEIVRRFQSVQLIVVGPWNISGSAITNLQNAQNAMRTAASEVLPRINGRVPFVDMRAVWGGSLASVVNLNNGGPAQRYISSDGVHPSTMGHIAIGRYIASQIYSVLFD